MQPRLIKGDLEVTLTHPTSNRDTVTVAVLTVRDRPSNIVVAEVNLTLQDFHDLMTSRSRAALEGTTRHAPGKLLAHVGKTRDALVRVVKAKQYVDDVRATFGPWLEDARRIVGAEQWSAHHSRRGYELELVFYGRTPEQLAALRVAFDALPAPEGCE